MKAVAYTAPGDRLPDARRDERLSWNRVLETMRDVADSPPNGCDLARRRYVTAKAVWIRAWLRLDQVRA